MHGDRQPLTSNGHICPGLLKRKYVCFTEHRQFCPSQDFPSLISSHQADGFRKESSVHRTSTKFLGKEAKMRTMSKLVATLVLALRLTSYAQADAVPISFIWGQFFIGPENHGSGNFYLGNGLIPMMDTPLYGARLNGLQFSLMSLLGSSGRVPVTDPVTGAAGFTISGPGGGQAEFAFVSQPTFSESDRYYLQGEVRLLSNSIPDVDLSAFSTGGYLNISMDYLDPYVYYGQDFDAILPPVGGGASFTLVAGGGNTGGQIPEPTTLLTLTLLGPAGWWYARRRRCG